MTRTKTPPAAKPNALAQWIAAKPGRSQSALARRIGCAPSAISMIARDERTPRKALLKKLHTATGLSVAALMGVGR